MEWITNVATKINDLLRFVDVTCLGAGVNLATEITD